MVGAHIADGVRGLSPCRAPWGRHLCSPFLLMSVLRGEKFRLSRLQGELGVGRSPCPLSFLQVAEFWGGGAGLV